jgi:hypothetical protein
MDDSASRSESFASCRPVPRIGRHASAECAWVLWRRAENQAPAKVVQHTVPPEVWEPVATKDARAACDETENTFRQTEANGYLVWRGERVQLAESRPGSLLISGLLT